MTQKDIPNCFLPVTQLSEKMEEGVLSSLELIEEYLERIRKHDRNLGAFIDVYEEDSLKAASASDMARASGHIIGPCLLYTSPSPRDRTRSRMPSSA